MLVRSAHSANIKERRDCSTALFDAARRDGHAGRAHPRAPRRDARRRRGGARRGPRATAGSWILNDPYRGGTHLPDITVVTPVLDDDGALLGFAASRAHHADVGGRVARLDARRLDDARRGGRRHRAARARRGRDRRARRADAPARPAPRRPARAARRQPHRRAAPRASSPSASAPTRCARRPPPCSTTPSGARAPASPRCDDGPREARDVLEAREGDLELRARRDRRRRRADRSTSPAAPRSTTATSTARSRSRARPPTSRCACSPTPTSRRAPAPTGRSTVRAPEGSLLNAAPAAPPSRAATSRRPPRRRPRARRLRPRARPGHDEQPHARHRRRSRTTRRSAAARARAPTPTARAACTSRCRNTLNTPVEALELEFPLRVVALRDPPRLGRRRRAPRRRRRRARARGARADGLLAHHRAPPPRAAGRRRRRAGRARAQPAQRRASCRRRRRATLRRGDSARDRDAGRRRPRRSARPAALHRRRNRVRCGRLWQAASVTARAVRRRRRYRDVSRRTAALPGGLGAASGLSLTTARSSSWTPAPAAVRNEHGMLSAISQRDGAHLQGAVRPRPDEDAHAVGGSGRPRRHAGEDADAGRAQPLPARRARPPARPAACCSSTPSSRCSASRSSGSTGRKVRGVHQRHRHRSPTSRARCSCCIRRATTGRHGSSRRERRAGRHALQPLRARRALTAGGRAISIAADAAPRDSQRSRRVRRPRDHGLAAWPRTSRAPATS